MAKEKKKKENLTKQISNLEHHLEAIYGNVKFPVKFLTTKTHTVPAQPAAGGQPLLTPSHVSV